MANPTRFLPRRRTCFYIFSFIVPSLSFNIFSIKPYIQAHLVSRHGLTTASLQLVSSTLSRLCLMSRPKRQATKFIPNHTTLHHPPGGSADQCGGPLPPLREAQLLRRHLQQHRPPRPPPPRAHRRPRRPSFFLFLIVVFFMLI